MKHKPIWYSSGFLALSLVLVFATGGFSDRTTLRAQVASLNQEVEGMRGSLIAQVGPRVPGPVITVPICNPVGPATVKIISPNGGERLYAGQRLLVTWDHCNPLSSQNSIAVVRIIAPATSVNPTAVSFDLEPQTKVFGSAKFTPNDGSELFQLPKNDTLFQADNTFTSPFGGYKIEVEVYARGTSASTSASLVKDQSDAGFTVTASSLDSGIMIEPVSSDAQVISTGGSINKGEFKIKFKVTAALGDDIYVSTALSGSWVATSVPFWSSSINPNMKGFAYTLWKDSSPAYSNAAFTQRNPILTSMSGLPILNPAGVYRIKQGTSELFEVTVTVLPAANGMYRMSIPWALYSASPSANPTMWTYPTGSVDVLSTSYITL